MRPAYHQKIKQQGLWCFDFGSSFGGSGRTGARVKRGEGETLFQNRQKGSISVALGDTRECRNTDKIRVPGCADDGQIPSGTHHFKEMASDASLKRRVLIEDEETKWEHDWRDFLQTARSRPGMVIGDQQTGHHIAVRWALSLVWDAKAFCNPEFACVSISPHQYLVRCETGPLLLSIEKMTTWAGKRILTEGWNEALSAGIEQDGRVGRRRGWRYAFTGPTGPRLDSPTNPSVLARRFVFGIRNSAGLWCQTFAQGWPTSAPFLLQQPSRVGLLVAADLDPQWFRGLPFTPEDSQRLLTLRKDYSYMSQVRRRSTGVDDLIFRRRERVFTFPNTRIHWRDEDDLVNDTSLTASGIQEWL